MPDITKAALSRLVGVSKAAISKAVSSHHLTVTGDGLIDTDVPSNAAWIAAKRAGIRQANRPRSDTVSPPKDPLDAAFQAAAQKRKAAKEAKAARRDGDIPEDAEADEDEGDPEDPDGLLHTLIGAEAEKLRFTRARRIDTEKASQLKDITIATRKGELIGKEVERRRWSAFDAALKSNLRDLPRRASARLHAIAVSEGARALESALEEEISRALVRVVQEAKAQGLAE